LKLIAVFFRVAICKGPYPDDLLEAWDRWEDEKGTYNERPSEHSENQLYAVLVLRNGGTDLEHYKLRKWSSARSLLLQLTLSLAAAESSLQFEHRDLHWGNILCMDLKEKKGAIKKFAVSRGVSTGDGNNSKRSKPMWVQVDSAGLKVTVIDYTWSRCQKGIASLVLSETEY
jgi:serine/threonine-protein kinase haspin